MDSSSTGRFFRDYLHGKYKEDGYQVLYKVHGIGAGLGYRYITGPKKEGATKGKYYQEVPVEKLSSDYKGDESAISNFFNMAAEFGNCRLEGGVGLRSGKKPEKLLQQILEIGTEKKDLVLDFFAGSGTTGAVAHKMERQYILLEQMEYFHDLPEARLKNVIVGDQTGISKDIGWKGGGSFTYTELMPLNEKYVREIEGAKSKKDIEKIWKEIQKNGFLSYKIDPKKFKEGVKDFAELELGDQKKFILESLAMNMLYVNYNDIDDKDYKVSKEDKELNKEFYE